MEIDALEEFIQTPSVETPNPESNSVTDVKTEVLIQPEESDEATPIIKNSTEAPPSPFVMKSEKMKRVEAKLQVNPFDIDAWAILFSEAHASKEVDLIREAYEKVLAHFPTSAHYWLKYADFELKNKAYDKVESIFSRCLRSVLSVDLWKFYLNYVMKLNIDESGRFISETSKSTVQQSYEFALQHIGTDKDAGSVWADYIHFLKNAETTNLFEEQQKMDLVRKTYQKAVSTPLSNVESLWKEYDAYENTLNKLTAKKFLAEKAPQYMAARTALRELNGMLEQLNLKCVLPVPPNWTKWEAKQLHIWKKYIMWEKCNHLQIEDKEELISRVLYAYRNALLTLRFYPEIWYDAGKYSEEVGRHDEAIEFLKEGKKAIPHSFLLNFGYAEMEEQRKNIVEARATYDSLVNLYLSKICTIEEKNKKLIDSMQKQIDMHNSTVSPEEGEEDIEKRRRKMKDLEAQKSILEKKGENELIFTQKKLSLVWIMYMRFARRAEGIKASRLIFGKARKQQYCGYHVFIESALMEYYCSKDASIAGKIFELGLKSFGAEPGYVSTYFSHLIHLNDDSNARSLFERSLNCLTSEESMFLWNNFTDYENKYGDLSGMLRLEKRRVEAFPKESVYTTLLNKWSFLDLDFIAENELGMSVKHSTDTVYMKQMVVKPMKMDQDSGMIKNRDGSHKRHILESVHPEKYSRPDFSSGWSSYNPADAPPPIPDSSKSSTKPKPQALLSQPATGQSNISPQLQQQSRSPQMEKNEQQKQPVVQPGITSASDISGVISYFISRLPAPQAFTGPVVNADHLMDLLKTINFQTKSASIHPQGGVASHRDQHYEPSPPPHRHTQGATSQRYNDRRGPRPRGGGGNDRRLGAKRRRRED